MNQYTIQLQNKIEPYRQQIINHPVYAHIKTIEDLGVFMQHHVYAVWDFMSLLKSLQNNLTCTSVPWFPKGSAESRFLINEIVVGEESDVDENGIRMSHFELYLNAMKQSGAELNGIQNFIQELSLSNNLDTAFKKASTAKASEEFVRFTFNVINSKKDYLQAAIFTFGREDLIPGMFLSLVAKMHQEFPQKIATFKYYLERHIEVDGDHHSHLALQMTENLCANDESKWKEVEETTILSLQKRLGLWDGALQQILHQKASPNQ